MIDIGVTKLAIIGGIALVVIGPEKLPGLAKTIGTLLGRARRYVADVKAEVNRSIELEELKKMKTEFEHAARDVEQSVQNVSTQIHETGAELEQSWQGAGTTALPPNSGEHTGWVPPPPAYKHPKKNWRLKRGATPQWYKQRAGVRGKAQSGAARVARFRPPRATV